MRDQFYGAIERYSDSDYLAGGELVLPEAPYRFSDLKHQYNQDTVSAMSCTVFGPIGAVTDITHHIFSHEECTDCWNLAKAEGSSDETGGYISVGFNVVRKYFNAKNNDKLHYYRIPLTEHEKVLPKGYSLVTGFRGNKNYNQDVNDNGTLDNTTFGVSTYGHCIRITKDGNEYVVDNYVGGKWNVYRVADLDTLIKNGVFFNEAYFFVTQQSLDLMAKQPIISDWARDAVEWCRKNGYATIWTNPQEIVANAVTEKMWYNAGILTTYTGLGVTKERMAVILYKTRKT